MSSTTGSQTNNRATSQANIIAASEESLTISSGKGLQTSYYTPMYNTMPPSSYMSCNDQSTIALDSWSEHYFSPNPGPSSASSENTMNDYSRHVIKSNSHSVSEINKPDKLIPANNRIQRLRDNCSGFDLQSRFVSPSFHADRVMGNGALLDTNYSPTLDFVKFIPYTRDDCLFQKSSLDKLSRLQLIENVVRQCSSNDHAYFAKTWSSLDQPKQASMIDGAARSDSCIHVSTRIRDSLPQLVEGLPPDAAVRFQYEQNELFIATAVKPLSQNARVTLYLQRQSTDNAVVHKHKHSLSHILLKTFFEIPGSDVMVEIKQVGCTTELVDEMLNVFENERKPCTDSTLTPTKKHHICALLLNYRAILMMTNNVASLIRHSNLAFIHQLIHILQIQKHELLLLGTELSLV